VFFSLAREASSSRLRESLRNGVLCCAKEPIAAYSYMFSRLLSHILCSTTATHASSRAAVDGLIHISMFINGFHQFGLFFSTRPRRQLVWFRTCLFNLILSRLIREILICIGFILCQSTPI
jgi:hypothetical protein